MKMLLLSLCVLSAPVIASAQTTKSISLEECYTLARENYPLVKQQELIAKSKELNDLNIKFCATRYGNVMASRGSVIPLIINQIKNGKDITVTDPNMTRFMMSLDEAVGLVWFAYQNSQNGDIFVQKSSSTTIENLVLALKEIYGAKNKIRLIGTRHGEKLYETLVNREEMSNAIEIQNYYRIPSDKRNLNYNIYYSKGEKKISNFDDYNSHNSELLTKEELELLNETWRTASLIQKQEPRARFKSKTALSL